MIVVRGMTHRTVQTSRVAPMTGTVAAGKPIWTVASTTAWTCRSLVAKSKARNRARAAVRTQPARVAIRARRPARAAVVVLVVLVGCAMVVISAGPSGLG